MGKRKKTPKRLTKRERKALEGRGPTGNEGKHIHCVACGRHMNSNEFTVTPSTARYVTCNHGSKYAACVGCVGEATRRLAEHDRTGQPVRQAQAWH
jgi:hypothetical protein